MKTLSPSRIGTALLTLLVLSPPATFAQTLVNGDFENGLTGWSTFGNAYSDPAHAHSGANGLKLYGNWWSAWDATGAYQNLAANAGETWTLHAFGLNPSSDAISGGNQNFALLKLIWFDGPNGTGNALQPLAGPGAVFGSNPGIESQQLNNQTPLDTWVPLSAGGVAPPGTQSVQIFGGLFLQPNWEGGSLWLDNETLTVVPEPGFLALFGLGLLGWLRRK